MDMKRNLFFIGVLLIHFQCLFAQDLKGVFTTSVDYINCKAVETSLKSVSPNDENIRAFQNECPCMKPPVYTDIEKALLKYHSKHGVSQTLKLSKEINGLNGSFSSDWEREDILVFLTENIFTSSDFPEIKDFANHDAIRFKQFKNDIQIELKKILAISNIETPLKDTKEVSKKKEEKPEIRKETTNIGWLFYFLLIFNTITVIAIIVLTLKYKLYKLYNIVDIEKKLQGFEKLKTDIEGFKGIIEDMSSTINLRQQPSIMPTIHIKQNTEPSNVPKNIDTSYKDNQESIFYFPEPEEDGSFNNQYKKTNHIQGKSIYKFIIKGKFATFEIAAESVKLASEHNRAYIDPCCEVLKGTYSFETPKIKTISLGEAKLNGEKWELLKKYKFEYV